jgi:ribonuclease HI
MNKITIYCDGACSGNPGVGGWAFVVPHLRYEESDYEIETTNNRMEITACIKALKYILEFQPQFNVVEIITDSQYVVNTMTKGWKKNKNTDLWDTLESLVIEFQHKVIWTWVKGHADNKHNQRCDELAVKEYTAYKELKEQEKEYEKRRELDWYGKKDSILGIENISLLFRPYEKYIVSDKDYVIIYQSMCLDDVFVAEANSKELLGGGSYSECRQLLQNYKIYVEQGYSNLPF